MDETGMISIDGEQFEYGPGYLGKQISKGS